MKGLILCAGKGTRLYPITAAYPKTLIPVANIPILHSSIKKLTEQGITDIGIVIHPSQHNQIYESVGNGNQWGAALTYIYQNEAKGIADAVKQAEPFVGNDNFILLLGDNLFSESLSELRLDVEERGSQGSLLVAEVANPQDYGIANVSEGRIIGVEEKPREPKSKLAVLGAYAFTHSIFRAVHEIAPSARGEYEITEAIQWLINENLRVTYHVTKRANSDVGTIERWLEANRHALDARDANGIHETAQLINCTIEGPVSIAEGSVLKNCHIGPYVSIGSNCILEGCRIENSILLNRVQFKQAPAAIRNTVIGIGSAMLGLQPRGEGGKQ